MPIVAAVLVAGCSSAAAPTTAVEGATTPAQSAATSSATVMTADTSAGTVLVAGSNGMTVYTFASDTANSGQSACTGGCIAKWPALTIPAGTTPSAGPGIAGTLATITRSDDGTLQVTYNGLPLYFYVGDKAPGDMNGNYPGWSSVAP